MTIAIRLILMVFGLFFTINSCVVAVYSNFTIGIIGELLLGLVMFLWGLFYKSIKKYASHGIKKTVKNIIGLMIAGVFVICGFLGLYGKNDTVDYNENAVIVLGCAVKGTVPTQPLAARLDAAIEYHEKNPDAYIVVTGGQGHQEHITEAECMKNYLINHGVSEDKIIEENKATSTNENLEYSRELMESDNISLDNLALITNDFHIFRAKRLAKLNGLEVKTMNANTPWYNASMMYIREIFAVGQLILFKK